MRCKSVFITVLAALFLFFVSCSSDSYSSIYEQGDYERLVTMCDRALEEGLSQDALYYKMMACYRLGRQEESVDAALAYSLIYSSKEDERLSNALRIILLYDDDPVLRVQSGHRLADSGSGRTSDQMYYFSALMDIGDYETAAEVYNSLRDRISSRDAALLCISAGASSGLIASNLESWYSQEGYSQEFRNAVVEASGILLQRSEGQLALPLVFRIRQGESDSLSNLILGDIYAQMGDEKSARTYYGLAYLDYPSAVSGRLIQLQAN